MYKQGVFRLPLTVSVVDLNSLNVNILRKMIITNAYIIY